MHGPFVAYLAQEWAKGFSIEPLRGPIQRVKGEAVGREATFGFRTGLLSATRCRVRGFAFGIFKFMVGHFWELYCMELGHVLDRIDERFSTALLYFILKVALKIARNSNN